MKLLSVVLFFILSTGCASTMEWVEDNPEEAAWQFLHLVDAAQTLAMTNDPTCYRERDPLTKQIVGDRPDRDKVYKWAVGSAVVHYLLFKAIEDTRFDKPLRIADMTFKVNVVYTNHQNGLRLTRSNDLPSNCRR